MSHTPTVSPARGGGVAPAAAATPALWDGERAAPGAPGASAAPRRRAEGRVRRGGPARPATRFARAKRVLAVWTLAACARAEEPPLAAGGSAHAEARGEARDAARDTGIARGAQDWRVSPAGLGTVRFGQSVAEASAALGAAHGGALTAPASDAGCAYAVWKDGLPGVRFLIEGGRVVRVDVGHPAAVATVVGVGVGDPAARVWKAYGDRVRVTPAKYTAGQVLTVTPERPADSTSRLVFEVDSGRVVRYRAGLLPAVEYVEGCG